MDSNNGLAGSATRALAVSVGVAALCVAGCGGSSSTRTSRAKQRSAAGPRLTAAETRRLGSICRAIETDEDHNVIAQFAARGYSIASPSVMHALGVAGRDVARESTRVKAAGGAGSAAMPLTHAMETEARVLRALSAGHDAQTNTHLLPTVIRGRATAARASGVRSCAR